MRTGLYMLIDVGGRNYQPHLDGRESWENVIRAVEVGDPYPDRTEIDL